MERTGESCMRVARSTDMKTWGAAYGSVFTGVLKQDIFRLVGARTALLRSIPAILSRYLTVQYLGAVPGVIFVHLVSHNIGVPNIHLFRPGDSIGGEG